MIKLIRLVISCCLILLAALLSSCTNSYRTDDISKYSEYLNGVPCAEKHMPNLDEIGNFKNVTISRKKSVGIISSINSVSLIAEYDAESYEAICKSIESKYEYLGETTEYLTDINANINGYEIKVVKKEEASNTELDFYDYPKAFLMIGFNKQKNSIAYFYHYDIDVDYIDDLDEYIAKEYEWE